MNIIQIPLVILRVDGVFFRDASSLLLLLSSDACVSHDAVFLENVAIIKLILERWCFQGSFTIHLGSGRFRQLWRRYRPNRVVRAVFASQDCVVDDATISKSRQASRRERWMVLVVSALYRRVVAAISRRETKRHRGELRFIGPSL